MAHNDDHVSNKIASALLGAVIGASLSLGAYTAVFDGTLWFPGDMMLAGALICGALGWFWGEEFFEWLRENWWWFW